MNEYVKLRRIAIVSEVLKNSDKRIIDVALDYGFSNHANFTRAFKDAYGITPEEYRSCPVMLNHFVKPELLLNYVIVDEDVRLIADGIVVEVTRKKLDEPRTFIGIEGELPDVELTGGKATGVATTGVIWSEFHHKKSNVLDLLPNGNEIGVFYHDFKRRLTMNSKKMIVLPYISKFQNSLGISGRKINAGILYRQEKIIPMLLVIRKKMLKGVRLIREN